MTHKAKSPDDGLDATKINKSDGGAGVTRQRDGWFKVLVYVQSKRCRMKEQFNLRCYLF